MGNICQIQQQNDLTSFQEYYSVQVRKTNRLHQSNDDQRIVLREVFFQNIEPSKCSILNEQVSTKNPKNNHHGLNLRVIPPSQHSLKLIQRLQQQSQVPSDFFQTIDFSQYFKTIKTLKQNISQKFLSRIDKQKQSNLGPSISSFAEDLSKQKSSFDQRQNPRTQRTQSNKEQNFNEMSFKKNKRFMTHVQFARS